MHRLSFLVVSRRRRHHRRRLRLRLRRRRLGRVGKVSSSGVRLRCKPVGRPYERAGWSLTQRPSQKSYIGGILVLARLDPRSSGSGVLKTAEVSPACLCCLLALPCLAIASLALPHIRPVSSSWPSSLSLSLLLYLLNKERKKRRKKKEKKRNTEQFVRSRDLSHPQNERYLLYVYIYVRIYTFKSVVHP